MRMSCNGCWVLRKGCSDACTIRPCLQWIKTPEAQANATVFLAKFYGRAGLLNLLAAPSSDALRPAVFRSLLYEACGRIVNPVYGSVGLLWSGQWQACQAAVEAVLKGDPVVVRASDQPEEAAATPPLGACDIRHVAKDHRRDHPLLRASRPKFKRASSSSTTTSNKASSWRVSSPPTAATPTREQEHDDDDARTPSHHDHMEESAGSQGSSEAGSNVSQADEHHSHVHDDDEVSLQLTLGFEPVVATRQQARSPSCDLRAASSLMELRLELPA
jgi:hypothetical protein